MRVYVRPPKFGKYDILLYNQADVSIVHPRLLCNVLPADLPITVKGIGGKQLKAEHNSYLQEFFKVYASEQANPSVLSLSDVVDLYKVSYVSGEAFIVHLPTYDLAFKRTGKLYVAYCRQLILTPCKVVHATVVENESIYTQSQIKKAKEAYEFLKCSGYPLPDEAIHLFQDGNMREKVQTLHTDVMHLEGHKFLISLVEPLQLTLQKLMKDETADQLGLGLQGQLSLLRTKGFQPTVVYIDPQMGFQTIKNLLPGVLIDDSGAEDNVPKVDIKIRSLKRKYRAVKNGLPWNLPVNLVKNLVGYAVAHMNICRTSTLSTNISPYAASITRNP
jgi:hypothetical protein